MTKRKQYSKEFKLDAIALVVEQNNGLLCQRNEVKYSFIAQHKKIWPMVLMCHVLGVKSNNFYIFQKRKSSMTDDPTHQEMIELVKDIAKFSDNTYGTRRIKHVLNTLSFPVSRRKTAQLMKEANICVRYKKKYKAATNSDHNQPVCPNELNMKHDDNRHNFTGHHLPFSLVFLRNVFKQLFSPLRDKYFAKIIDITKQLN